MKNLNLSNKPLFCLGACGGTVPNTIAKIVDIETREALGPNQDGELLVSGPQVSIYLSIFLTIQLSIHLSI